MTETGPAVGGPLPVPVTAARRAEVEALLEAFGGVARAMPAVAAVGLCGSWAAGRPTMGSDVT